MNKNHSDVSRQGKPAVGNKLRSGNLAAIVACLVVMAVSAMAQEATQAEAVEVAKETQDPAAVTPAQEPHQQPVIDPEAETVLRQLSDHNKQVKTAVLRLTDTIDEVQADGRKIQFSHVRKFTVARPDKLKVETTGDVTSRTLWKDGKTLTVLDRDKNVYAQIPDPGTIDQAIDLLQEKYNMSLPAADLLSEDVYETMTANCNAIDYVGIGYVGEEKCHHLAFAGDNIDWQMWISTGDKPSTRKMVITYKQLPGEPQYTMQLLNAGDAGKIDDAVFACELPEGAVKIEFQPVEDPKLSSRSGEGVESSVQEKEAVQ